MSDLTHQGRVARAGETDAECIDRLSYNLAYGLAVQARRDAITKRARAHGIKAEWQKRLVVLSIGDECVELLAARLDGIERVLEEAIRRAPEIGGQK